MSFKTIVIAILSATAAIILYKNREESIFWLFGEIKTSKLILLGVFYALGIITGGILFRRKSKHPKEYAVNNSNTPSSTSTTQDNTSPYSTSNLTDEDKNYLRRD